MEACLRDRRVLKYNLQKCKESMFNIIQRKQIDLEGVSRLEVLLENEYKPLKEKFSALVFKINDSCEEGNEEHTKKFESALKESDEYRETYSIVGSKIKIYHKALGKETSRRSLLSSGDNTETFVTHNSSNQPKLKRIDVPTFDGNLQKFYSFRSLFENLVHDNKELSNVQKLYYLKEALVGSANAIVKDFDLEENSYPEAWSYFLSRYNNRRAIIRDYFREFKNLSPIKNESQIRELVDSVNGFVRGLKAAGEKVEDTFSRYIVYHITTLLDPSTAKDWENSLCSCDSFPKFDALEKFLQVRTFAVEERSKEIVVEKGAKSKPDKKTFVVSKSGCIVCKMDHLLINCKKFLSLKPFDRFQIIKKNSLCLNCFNSGHTAGQCTRSGCKTCSKKHHHLLHFDPKPTSSTASTTPPVVSSSEPKPDQNTASLSCYKSPNPHSFVLLPTAVVNFACNHIRGVARVLLDSCSQLTLISDTFVRKYRLPTYTSECDGVSGIGGVINSPFKSALRLSSRYEPFEICIDGNVVPQSSVSYKVPPLSISNIHSRINHLQLADPAFQHSRVDIANVDMIIGASFYERCMREEKLEIDGTFLRRSHFGWVLSGPINQKSSYCSLVTSNANFCGYATQKIDALLERFFKFEEIPSEENKVDIEEQNCVRHFESTYRRDPKKGDFIVRLPFKETFDRLANNFPRAVASFNRVEKSLEKSPDLKSAYVDFMREYEKLNHMSLVPESDVTQDTYYCPHRAVVRPENVTTKVRVVFNASAKTRSGLSLNDVLMKGPTLQQELFDILLSFRCHLIAFVADIEKMYRCIQIDPLDRKYQRIVWREKSCQTLKEYELNTLTYGTKPASFIATKCLSVVAAELQKSNPSSIAARFISECFYMDDLLAGADSLTEALELQKEIHSSLRAACFPLRKYKSNSIDLLKLIADTDQVCAGNATFDFAENTSVLGLIWEPSSDTFSIKCQLSPCLPEVITKRICLSQLSRVFDPMGFLSPVTIRAKIIMQLIWREKLDWDAPLTESLSQLGLSFCAELPRLVEVKIDRRYSPLTSKGPDQLVGFCDASLSAYCAVVYLRRVSADIPPVVSMYIVCSKTRVAPIKSPPLSIPKLELQAAVLLSSLLKRVAEKLRINFSNVFAFTDSTVVLDWLKKSPTDLAVFEKNRVSQIQSIGFDRWAYVESKNNPADLATRGISVQSLVSSHLWFNGPSDLLSNNVKLPEPIEFKVKKVAFVASNAGGKLEFFIDKFSSFNKVLRVTAYLRRFCKLSSCRGPLIAKELEEALKCLIFFEQRKHFGQDPTKNKSILSLNPFLDSSNIVRVGGRLANSSLSFDARHPIILPSSSQLVTLLVRHIHLTYFHPGQSFILNFVRSKFWVTKGVQRIIKKLVRSCVICRRYRAETVTQIMGDLPPDRVRPARSFSIIGVDFAGPFTCKCIGHRSLKHTKVYAALFVCFVVRAVHIELVASLSTEDFIFCLKRFIARRGIPAKIYSDNATNFVGARNQLALDYAASQGFEWVFIPPRSPNFGGLWEAAVKSAKFHLIRCLNGAIGDREQFETFFSQIEAILNSRPLCTKRSSTDVVAITPAHFLVGDSLLSLPEAVGELNPSPTKIESLLQSFQNRLSSFWHHWQYDYLAQLQSRGKWKLLKKSVPVDTIVVLKESNVPPNRWALGRIVNTYPDPNGVVRVADVWCNGAVKKRSIASIVPLLGEEC